MQGVANTHDLKNESNTSAVMTYGSGQSSAGLQFVALYLFISLVTVTSRQQWMHTYILVHS